MKAQVITKFGDPAIFETIEAVKPEPETGQVLIRVKATSVNPIDYKIRKGDFPDLAPAFPAVLHGDVAGIIEAVGPEVRKFKVGDAVYGFAGGLVGSDGALAEFMLADAKLLAKKPETISMMEAAALPLVSITVWEALFEKVSIKPSQKVLVHAGTGGVGHIGIQLAKYAGAEVYATVSSDKKAQIAKSLGATGTINYVEESVQEYVQRVTDGKGFDVVFDTVGGDNINQSLEAVSLYGDVVTILSSSSHDLTPLLFKSASLHVVFTLLPLIHNIQRERHGNIMEKISAIVDQDQLKPLLDPRVFSFDEVGAAHALLESGKAIGKVVIKRD